MIRYGILVICAVLAINTAASAQNSDQYYQDQNPRDGTYQDQYKDNGPPPGHYYCQTHDSYCSHQQNFASPQDRRNYEERQRFRELRTQSKWERQIQCPDGYHYCEIYKRYYVH